MLMTCLAKSPANSGAAAWTAVRLDLPGCSGSGDTQEAALRSLHESIAELVRIAAANGWPVPAPPDAPSMVKVYEGDGRAFIATAVAGGSGSIALVNATVAVQA